MREINVKMKDLLTGKEVERNIDISNFYIPDYSAHEGWESDTIAPLGKQETLLKEWIKDRANEQHNTILELISWSII